jgi:replicative DNA helicase
MSFNDTADLERSLLNTLTKSMMSCRKHMQSVKEEWFTSEARQFIFKLSLGVFRKSKSILSEKVFEYEVDKLVDPKEHKYYLGEWNLIQAITVGDPPEALIDRLAEAAVGRNMMDAIEKIIEKAEAGDIAEAVSLYKRTAVTINSGNINQPIVELTDYKHRLALIRDKQSFPEKYLGIKTGFKTFDNHTGGLFPGELTLIAGVTGLGKSTLVKQLQKGIIENNTGKNVLHIANEESQLQVETKFDALMTEIPYLDFKLARMTEEEIERWVEKMDKDLKKPGRGRVFIKEVPAFTDVTLVEQAYRELEAKGIKIHVIIIDHLPHIIPIMKSWGENDEKAKAAADCKQLSKDLNCSVVIPTQAATEVEEKQQKGKRAGKLDVYGSKAQVHVANTFMIITSKGKVEDHTREQWEWDVNWLVDIKKNRDGASFCFLVRHYVRFGKVEEIFEKNQGKSLSHVPEEEEIEQINEAVNEALKEATDDTEVDDVDDTGIEDTEDNLTSEIDDTEKEDSDDTDEADSGCSIENVRPLEAVKALETQVTKKPMSVLEKMRMKKIQFE